jgi:hypothetical protein
MLLIETALDENPPFRHPDTGLPRPRRPHTAELCARALRRSKKESEMHDEHLETSEKPRARPTDEYGIGAKALALAGFSETLIDDDISTIISPHGGVVTFPMTGH